MSQATLFDANGAPAAYIDHADENTIYSFEGEPLAYLDGDNVYGFNGKHIGWYEEGILWDHSGARAGYTKNTSPVFTQFEPFKSFKQFKPFKAFKEFAPFKPFKGAQSLDVPLYQWLANGKA